MGVFEQIQQHREAILSAAKRHGASNLRIFGSVGRGDETEDSDVDFLVALEEGRSLLDHAALKIDLEAILGRPVDVATESGLKEKYRDRVLREAVAI